MNLLKRARFHLLRLGMMVAVLALILAGLNLWAAGVLALLFGINFGHFLRLSRSGLLDEDEDCKPYPLLILRWLDGLLILSVLGAILVKDVGMSHDAWPKLLTVGFAVIAIRCVAWPIYGLSLIRGGKSLGDTSPWSRLARLFVTATTMAYVLEIPVLRELLMGATLFLLLGSATAFIYRYYRDPEHRKPLSLASQITISRIVLTPVFIVFFFHDNDLIYANNSVVFKILAFWMVVLFMLTDWLDGYLARRMNEVSTLGKYLDPFSDKISNFTIFLCFMASGYASIWMVALIYFREASVETLRTLAASQNITIAARQSGKWKTALQGTGILLILAGAVAQTWLPLPGFWEEFAWWTMATITAITIASGVDYFVASQDVLKKYL
jgi:CDP-diacylglycerol--glycerol-3-phosphate 3-phosphatidyltransferase